MRAELTPLETERLALRRFRADDLEALAALLADPEIMRFLEPPYDRARTARFLAEAGLGWEPLVWALTWRATGALIGYVIFHPWAGEEAWELGWVLARRWWGMGLAGEITAALIERARAMGVPALVIECDPRQSATVRIAEKCGFRREDPRDGLLVFRKALVAPEGLRLVPIGPERAGEARRLLEAAYAPLYARYHDEGNPARKSEEAVRAALARSNTDGWLLCQGGEAIGCVRVAERAPGEYSLADLAVHPDHQGRGCAQWFLRALEERYPQARRWSLVTVLEEKKDCHLYEKLGYRQEGVIAEVRPGMHLVLYGKAGPKP